MTDTPGMPMGDSAFPLATIADFTPVPRKPRQGGWTEKKQRAFIQALAVKGSVTAAAKSVGMTPESAYILRRAPGGEEFAAAWEAALDDGLTILEDCAIERAIHGVEVPVYSYGKLIGTRRVYNDRLLMFLLRNRMADRYGSAVPVLQRLKVGAQSERTIGKAHAQALAAGIPPHLASQFTDPEPTPPDCTLTDQMIEKMRADILRRLMEREA